MRVENEVYPSDREKFMAAGPEGPIFMVNLLKYKDKAEYKDGRETFRGHLDTLHFHPA